MKFFTRIIYLVLFGYLLCGFASAQSTGSEAIWIDVRTVEEYQEEHVTGALNIEYRDILAGVTEADIGKDSEILLYCGSGRRAEIALDALERAGFSNITNAGGLEDAQNWELGNWQAPTSQ